MALREGTARAGLEVTLEADCSLFVGELNHDVEVPGAISRSVLASGGVVVFQSSTDVRCQADVEARAPVRVLQDVHDVFVLCHAEVRSKSSASATTA
jgi:hypothetical protein